MDDQDGFVVVNSYEANPDDTPVPKKIPVSQELWESFFDGDGRIVQESRLRKCVFENGVEASLRKDIWKYLLGYFPFHTTYLEREIIQKQLKVEYQALKSHWKATLEPTTSNPAMLDLDSDEDPQMAFMKLQAMLNAQRLSIKEADAVAFIRLIKKDVPRTDRKVEYFAGDENPHLVWLHDILTTFAIVHPDVGYVQGMNDILSMILFVMDDEADAYNCFCGYMKAIHQEFASDGIVDQLTQLSKLLSLADNELFSHFGSIEAGDFFFCHRWILLSFKREFAFLDAIRLFEILSSHHLELSSTEAHRTRNLEKRKEKEKALGEEDANPGDDAAWWAEHQYKFGFFICLAVFKIYRARFMACGDVAAVYALINSLVETMDVDYILFTAERVFFEFCRMSAHKELL